MVDGRLRVHRGERADSLADALAALLADPLPDPFTADVVAVPAAGMERWLAQRLSHRLGAGQGEDGVCANVEFPSPATLVGEAVRGALRLDPDADPWQPERLVWPVLEVIDELADAAVDESASGPDVARVADGPPDGDGHGAGHGSGRPRAAGLGAHLVPAGSAGRERRFGTARRLAELFTGYALHRPELLDAWLAGGDGDVPADLRWQPELWRRVRARLGVPGPAERLRAACAALAADGGRVGLPARLSVFGPTRLPAAHLAVLRALALHREVHLWLPHPSPGLWARTAAALAPAGLLGHAVPSAGNGAGPGWALPRRRSVVPGGTDGGEIDTAAGCEIDTAAGGEIGGADGPHHPLLASLGRDVHETQLRLATTAPDAIDHHHPAAEPPATLLGLLQRDLRADRLGAADGSPAPLLAPDDRSVTVHACHGAHRQVEVLREAILGLLAADDTLEPRDVLVMCPDVETFAPLVGAAFGGGDRAAGADDGEPGRASTHPGQRLPVRLADRALRQVNPLLATVAQLLELADARLTASQVLDLAGTDPVRRRFRFDDADLDRLRDLVAAAGVRWGLDAAHRAPFGLDRFPQNTWSAGLDRLLLGTAMDGGDWLGTALPLEVESTDVDRVGRLAELVERLGTALAGLRVEQPLPAWVAALTGALDALTDVGPADAWQAAQARTELADVARAAGPAAAPVPLTLADLRALLARRLRGRPTRANFRTGALTVATLVPMRAVPHRVVCLLGLDDGAFPRAGVPDGDDALARDPRIGERDPRAEDRQLLLDAVCSATEHLVVLYSGADERTGARRPPAVPLGELLDTLDGTARTHDGRPVRDKIVVRHPLQPFDPRNFTAGALGAPGPFSFDRAELAGAVAAAGAKRPPAPVLAGPLPEAPADGPIALAELLEFVRHPARAFLRRRVGLTFTDTDDSPGDALPVEPAGLPGWAIGERLLRDRLRGLDHRRCQAAEWRRGELPPGALGQRLLAEIAADVEPLVGLSAELRGADAVAVDVDVVVDRGLRVVGTVSGVHDESGGGGVVVRVEYSRMAPRHRLRAWVELLAVTAARPDRAWRAVTLARGSSSRTIRSTLGPVPAEHAVTLFGEIVELHRQGLREPLPLVPAASHAYAECRRAGGTLDDARARAAQEWVRDRTGRDDPAHRLVWGAGAPAAVLLEIPPEGPGTEDSRFGALAMRLWHPVLATETLERL